METISRDYRDLNRQMHETRPDYGANGHRYAGLVMEVCRSRKVHEVLDYGCGKGTLGITLRANGLVCHDYDPAISGKDDTPEPAPVVYCGDVAEHVEPEFLTAFLDDLQRVTQDFLLLVVATRPAKKTLADGRNAHLIQQPVEWWLPQLTARWDLHSLIANAHEFTFTGTAK